MKNNFFLLAFSCIQLLAIDCAHAIFIRHDISEASYFNLASNYDSVVRIVVPGATGTGTLVSQTQILTAAHVVDGDNDGVLDGALSGYRIRFGDDASGANNDLEISTITSVSIHPQWSATGGDRTFDLAVITMGTNVTAYTAMNISGANAGGLTGTMVGYGGHGVGSDSSPAYTDVLRRAAQNDLFMSGDDTLRSDFDDLAGNSNYNGSTMPLTLEGSTAPGDSGGAVFADFGNGDEIVGVLSGGFDSTGGDNQWYGDVSVWAPLNNSQNLSYLAGFGITPVPEPTSGILLMLSSCMLVFYRKKRSESFSFIEFD